MKKITLLLLAFVQGLFLFAQNDQQKEAEIRVMELVETQALLQEDIVTLQRIWSPGFMVNSPLNMVFIGGQVELVKAGIISYTSFSRTIEHVMVLKDVVITMGIETAVPTPPDPMAGQTVQRRFTNIWSKEKGAWILVARHANNICPAPAASGIATPNTNSTTTVERRLRVRQNPSTTTFHLDFEENIAGNIKIQVRDSNGRLIEKLDLAEGTKTISLGNTYQPGIYLAEVSNRVFSKTIKLIKQ